MPSFFSGAPKLTPSSDFSTTKAEMPLARLPGSVTVDAGVTYDSAKWHLKFSVYNALDDRYWQARSSDTNPVIVTAKPGTTWELMLKHDF